MVRVAMVLVVALVMVAHAGAAHACSTLAPSPEARLPHADQPDVPANAVLIATLQQILQEEIGIELLTSDGVPVDLDVTCEGLGVNPSNVTLCVGRPRSLLAPGDYVWTTLMNDSPQGSRSFTSVAATDDAAPPSTNWWSTSPAAGSWGSRASRRSRLGPGRRAMKRAASWRGSSTRRGMRPTSGRNATTQAVHAMCPDDGRRAARSAR